MAKLADRDRATVPPTVDVVALLARIDALERRDDAHERRIVRLESRHVRDDVHAAALVALAGSVRSLTFTAKSVIRHARQADPELLAALTAAGVDKPRSLGCWLRTLQQTPLAGLRVEKHDKDGDGALWTLRPAP